MIVGTAVLQVIAALAGVILGSFLLMSRGRDRLRVLFAFLCIATSIWIVSNYLGNIESFWLVITDYVTGAFLILLFWLFSKEMRLRSTAHTVNHSWILAKTTSLFVYLLIFSTVILILSGSVVYVNGSSLPEIVNGPLYGLYPFVALLISSASIYNLIVAYVRSRNAIHRTRVRTVLIGLLVAFTCIAVPNLVLQNIYSGEAVLAVSYAFSYVGVIIFMVLSTYAIIRHGLFDIKLAAVRSAAYILAIVTLSVTYYLVAYIVSLAFFDGMVTSTMSLNPVNLLLALVLALIFQPIKLFFDRITDKFFYKDNYKSEDFFATLSTLLTSTTDLRGLLGRASTVIASNFKAEQVFFYLYYTNGTRHHMSAGTHNHAKLPVYDAHMLDDFVATDKNDVVLTDFLEDNHPIHRMLVSHKVTLVMPLRRGDQVIGYVMLGERKSGNYTKRDLNILSTISNELVIAIQNALSLHEVKELNATLQQRIDVATKELRSSNAQLKHVDEVRNEFMGMASHQLRTPLTSVKGYLSMVLEGDVGKVTPQQHKLLQEAYNSSERMVHLIADFLNVSRLQTGKFVIEKTPMDIKAVVKQEVKSLEIMANGHGMKLRANITDAPLPLHADEQKVRQVIMNLIDNAIYYSHPNSTIVINVERISDDMSLTVIDTGIGVPTDEQSKLFTKFFRAKNARKQRPDGTGVGLYLARRVVHGHNGSIIFSSTEGKGSTFGFKLPLQTEKK